MEKIKIEVCCGGIDDVLVAAKQDIDRIELNSALEQGGVTPSRGVFLSALQVNIPIMVMVRPRGAGFCYSEAEFQTMLIDAKWFIDHGASGIVFGFLTEDGTVDVTRTQQMLAIIKDKEAVFHKAIDVCIDIEASLQILIDLGITRVLSAGGVGSVDDHRIFLKQLQEQYGNQIEILPGGGITYHNVASFLQVCPFSQIHLTAKKQMLDVPVGLSISAYGYYGVDPDHLAKVVAIVKNNI